MTCVVHRDGALERCSEPIRDRALFNHFFAGHAAPPLLAVLHLSLLLQDEGATGVMQAATSFCFFLGASVLPLALAVSPASMTFPFF